jgi:outer membrane protein assembly factor BamD (BamD/ComL family)
MKKYFSIFGLFFLLVSCTNQRQQKLDMIAAEENKLFNEMVAPANAHNTETIVSLYTAYVHDYPEDSLAPEFMFKKAQILMNTQRAKNAVQVLDTLIEQYPETPLLPQAMHLQAFIWDDKLGSSEMARISFERLIKRFPEHELSKNAQDYLQLIGLSDEEIIKRFQQNQQGVDTLAQ